MSHPLQIVLFVALPYSAAVVFVAGLIWRYNRRFTISSLSSQFLESRWLAWGALPFHLGVIILFAGHLLPLLMPTLWQSWMSDRTVLLTTETVGAAAAILCLAGLLVLLVRRVSARKVFRSSTLVDLVVLAILVSQVTIGLSVAMLHRWGAVWSARTTTPYFWSLVTFQPDPALVAGIPGLMVVHLTAAWGVLALIPFSRLVHMFSLPLHYLRRPPQKVIWLRG